MMDTRTWRMIALTSVVLVPVAASAQDSERGLDVRLSVNAIYDSNVARTGAANAAARGLTPEDFHLTPALTVTGNLPVGPHQIELSALAGYDFYNRNTRLNRERLNFDGRAAFDLPICDPTVSAGFSRRQSDQGDIVLLPGAIGDINSVKNVETVKSAGVSVACLGNGTIGIRPTASINYAEGRNDSDLRQRNNYDTLVYSGGLAYNHPTIGSVNLFVRRSKTDFPDQSALAVDNSYTVMGYGAGYERDIGSRLTARAELSYSDLKPNNPATPAFKGLNWNADISARVTDRLQLRTAFARSLDSGLAFDANYFVNRSISLDASYAVTDRITAQVGQSFRNRRFQGGAPTQGFVPPSDRQTTSFAKISYRQSPRLSFILDGSYMTRRADLAGFDYNNSRVGLGVEYSF